MMEEKAGAIATQRTKTTTLFMYRPSIVAISIFFAHSARQDRRDGRRLAPKKYEDAVPKHDLTRFEVSLYIELAALRKVVRATRLCGELNFFFRKVVERLRPTFEMLYFCKQAKTPSTESPRLYTQFSGALIIKTECLAAS